MKKWSGFEAYVRVSELGGQIVKIMANDPQGAWVSYEMDFRSKGIRYKLLVEQVNETGEKVKP